MKWLGWRKFLFTALVVMTSAILLIYGKITSDNFVSLNQIIVPAFLGANLLERWKQTDGNTPNNGPTA